MQGKAEFVFFLLPMEKEVTLFVIRKSCRPTSVTKVLGIPSLTKGKQPYLRNLYVKLS